jgi:acetoacetate decarboxylase/3-phenylpropionate/cinnamic acid dioxygenase small subunit
MAPTTQTPPTQNAYAPTTQDGFVPHKNVPGPARLQVDRADFSGSVNTDPQFIADRQAIINHVTAYAYLIDEGRWEDWYALFADDFTFETTVPEIGTVIIKGKEAFRPFIEDRYIKPGKTSKTVRRHTQGNVHVSEQTATHASVRTYMFISSVPKADHLHMLTTGTYNAELEKRDGKWTITRWYIEVDVPLSPSPLPTGFTEDQFKWIPDPSVELPGAPKVATPVKGQRTLKNLSFSQGNLYQNAPVWTWTDIDVIIVDYLTDAKSAAAFLPENLSTFPIPEMPGYALVKSVWAHYRNSGFGPYNEFMPIIPCLFEGQMFLDVPLIYVDRDSAMAGGREIGGWPKKMAKIEFDRVGDEYRVSLERNGQRLASAKINVGGKLFSTPLPADKPVSLPYPYNMTFPLPAPTGKPQEDVALPTSTLKFFPGVGTGELNPAPSVARVVGSPWHMKGTFFSGSGASASYRPSDEDPFYKLPILKILGGMYFEGDMSLALSEMRVLADWLKK